ncbi:hypothetical protein CEP54_007200 [Fusarium duplospermum]|uniref:Enoyl reductase (ER) domain-containing protein n=1 Tax=Fusarium duplospermum TaxID=1325734 RepID=A0A428Q339_9HYPO|nr:hypothetical protein CEP54_007200 [Fusarium duplospermum]
MANTTKALFVDQNVQFEVIQKNDLPKPADGELLIKVLFSGANPADIKHSTELGIINTTLGYDFCGEVIETTNSNSPYKPGDTVAGYTPSGLGRSSKYGSHQAYLTCPETMLFKVPDNLPQSDAACLTVVAMTAADALYNYLQFPLPGETERFDKNGPFLLWGATGAVGYCALQYAVASGISPIFVAATPEKFEHLESLGATKCFDYKAEDVYESINTALKALGHDDFTYAFDAAGAPNSGDQVLRCISDKTVAASTLFRESKQFKFPLATPNLDFTVQLAGMPHPITVPARPADYERAWKALTWAVENYGRAFRSVPVRVLDGTAESALKEIQRVVKVGGGFSKIAIQQPMK